MDALLESQTTWSLKVRTTLWVSLRSWIKAPILNIYDAQADAQDTRYNVQKAWLSESSKSCYQIINLIQI